MTLQQILKLSSMGGWLWTLPECEQQEAEQIHDSWLEYVLKATKSRGEEVSRVRKMISVWKEDPELAEFSKKARMRYLKQCLLSAVKEFRENREVYILEVQNQNRKEKIDKILKNAEGIQKKLNGYRISMDVLSGKRKIENVITDEMIEKAKEYPIENLLEHGPNGRAKCCFHQGEGWNMDIRKNFAHCYVCGDHGDAIKIYRALHGVGFKEAVLALQ